MLATGNSAGNNQIRNLAAPTVDSDAVNKKYVDDNSYPATINSYLSIGAGSFTENIIVSPSISTFQYRKYPQTEGGPVKSTINLKLPIPSLTNNEIIHEYKFNFTSSSLFNIVVFTVDSQGNEDNTYKFFLTGRSSGGASTPSIVTQKRTLALVSSVMSVSIRLCGDGSVDNLYWAVHVQ